MTTAVVVENDIIYKYKKRNNNSIFINDISESYSKVHQKLIIYILVFFVLTTVIYYIAILSKELE